jgi:integrase
MSVRKRTWTTAKGETKEKWIVDYFDSGGKRHIETYPRKRDADDRAIEIGGEKKKGVHTPRASAITIRQAGEAWLITCEANNLERATIETYTAHLRLHVYPYLGRLRLPEVTAPRLRKYKDDLLLGVAAPGEAIGQKRSPALVRKVMTTVGSMLADAQEKGQIAQNVARSMSRARDRHAKRREKRRLEVGRDIPSTGEVRAFIANLAGRWRPLLLTAIFTGCRASELRGLDWKDVDLKKAELHVRQRADKWGTLGRPKSTTSERIIPLPDIVVNALKPLKLQHQKGLVFPTSTGKPHDLRAIIRHGLTPAMIAAGLVDEQGKPKYGGLHALRHFYASWLINSVADGGLGLLPKRVQERLGHSSITLTMDVYGHLFSEGEEGRAGLAAAERALLA